LLRTDWEVATEPPALRIVQMECQRWGVDDGFKGTQDGLGWEAVHLRDRAGMRMRVALAGVAAGLLEQLGVPVRWESVALLARRGGWEPRPHRPPGTLTLSRGRRRLLDRLTTTAVVQRA
jgi:hypothetical protein